MDLAEEGPAAAGGKAQKALQAVKEKPKNSTDPDEGVIFYSIVQSRLGLFSYWLMLKSILMRKAGARKQKVILMWC